MFQKYKIQLILQIIFCFNFGVRTERHIMFPSNDHFPTECTLEDGTKAPCRNIKSCESALMLKTAPKTCYFEGSEQIVCCKERIFNSLKETPATKVCKFWHPRAFSILHGIKTKPLEFPYMVALGWESPKPDVYDYKCGGVLIDKLYVLTAAHCAYVNGLEPSVVLSGGGDLNATTSEIHKIESITVHPDYDDHLTYNDIAIIKLKDAVIVSVPACLWPSYALDDDNVIAMGYGHTVFAGLPSHTLLKAPLSVISNKACKKFYTNDNTVPNGISDTQLCASDPNKRHDTCQSDSGGPLIMKVPGNKVQDDADYVVGITSFGYGCGLSAPGVYTRVSAYIDWIEDIVWNSKHELYEILELKKD